MVLGARPLRRPDTHLRPLPISVLVPRAGNCPHRDRAWELVRPQYAALEVVEGYGDPNRWSKAEAVADALTRAAGDILVIADADVYTDHLDRSLEAVISGRHAWASPHKHVRRLTAAGTEAFAAGARETAEVEEEHFAKLGGGIVVVRRDLYELVPLDRRFVGWGGEDAAWAAALRTLAGPPKIEPQALWHLWHPPQPRQTRKVGNDANEELRGRYYAARYQPGPMRQLVEEARS